MTSSLILADLGNIGVTVSAVLTTASVAVYAWRARGEHGRWWKSLTGWHLMSYMAALALVLDQGVIYTLTTTGLLLAHAPPFRPDWFAWERAVSFDLLIPAVFAWRLGLIIRPPKPPGDDSDGKEPDGTR